MSMPHRHSNPVLWSQVLGAEEYCRRLQWGQLPPQMYETLLPYPIIHSDLTTSTPQRRQKKEKKKEKRKRKRNKFSIGTDLIGAGVRSSRYL